MALNILKNYINKYENHHIASGGFQKLCGDLYNLFKSKCIKANSKTVNENFNTIKSISIGIYYYIFNFSIIKLELFKLFPHIPFNMRSNKNGYTFTTYLS